MHRLQGLGCGHLWGVLFCLLHPSRQSLGRRMQGEAGDPAIESISAYQEAAFCTEPEIHVPQSQAMEAPWTPSASELVLLFLFVGIQLCSHMAARIEKVPDNSLPGSVLREVWAPHTDGSGQRSAILTWQGRTSSQSFSWTF